MSTPRGARSLHTRIVAKRASAVPWSAHTGVISTVGASGSGEVIVDASLRKRSSPVEERIA